MLAVNGVCRTISTEALQVITGKLSIDLKALKNAAFYSLRKNKPFESGGLQVTVSTGVYSKKEFNKRKADILHKLGIIWQHRWDRSATGRLTYLFIPEVDFVIKNKWFCPNQKLNLIITGHGCTNDKLFKLNLKDSATCPYCDEVETVLHVIFYCSAYASPNWPNSGDEE